MRGVYSPTYSWQMGSLFSCWLQADQGRIDLTGGISVSLSCCPFDYFVTTFGLFFYFFYFCYLVLALLLFLLLLTVVVAFDHSY